MFTLKTVIYHLPENKRDELGDVDGGTVACRCAFECSRGLTAKNIAFKSRVKLVVGCCLHATAIALFLAAVRRRNDGAAIFNPHQPPTCQHRAWCAASWGAKKKRIVINGSSITLLEQKSFRG